MSSSSSTAFFQIVLQSDIPIYATGKNTHFFPLLYHQQLLFLRGSFMSTRENVGALQSYKNLTGYCGGHEKETRALASRSLHTNSGNQTRGWEIIRGEEMAGQGRRVFRGTGMAPLSKHVLQIQVHCVLNLEASCVHGHPSIGTRGKAKGPNYTSLIHPAETPSG